MGHLSGCLQPEVCWAGEQLLGKEHGTMKTNHVVGGGGRSGASRIREVIPSLHLALAKQGTGTSLGSPVPGKW